jgi:hypothetical protein
MQYHHESRRLHSSSSHSDSLYLFDDVFTTLVKQVSSSLRTSLRSFPFPVALYHLVLFNNRPRRHVFANGHECMIEAVEKLFVNLST